MRPAWLCEHFAEEDIGPVRVEQGYRVRVLRAVCRGVDMLQRVLSVGLGAFLGEVEGLVVLDLVGRGLQEEGCSR
jgi:hypothetical protein